MLTDKQKQQIMFLEEQEFLIDEISKKLNIPEKEIETYIDCLRFPEIYNV